jgi:K+-sensing histidine kinase KdpD
VPPDKAGQLFEPFQRHINDRVAHPDGHGLGLSIVRAIADAHEARLEALPRQRGGLTITTYFPPIPGPRPADEVIRASKYVNS